MVEWRECIIGELGQIVGGATPSTKDEENYMYGEIPWITPKDLSLMRGRYISRGERNITKKGLMGCSAQLMPANSILFSSRAPIGYVAIAANELCTNQGFKSVVPNEETDYLFLYYLLKYNKDIIEGYGNGTTFREVSGSTMRRIKVKVPVEKSEQIRIGRLLSAIDDKIETNADVNDNLQQQAFEIFGSMFPNCNDGNRRIGDYIIPRRGKSLLSKDAIAGDVPVVAGGLEASTYHNISNTSAPVITISASGANAGFTRLWHIPVWSSDSSYIDVSMTDAVYFWYVLIKRRQQEVFDLQTGSAQPHIYPQHIANMAIPQLDMDAVHVFVEVVAPLFNKIGANISENNSLAMLRDSLLPKLMSGEIDVSEVEI